MFLLNPGFKADKLQASVAQFAGAPFLPNTVTSAQIRHTKKYRQTERL
jgi:hypothetical protein